MLGVNTLIQKLNTIIAGGSLTNLQVTELSKAIEVLEKRGVSVVATFADLPDPSSNTGRFFWVESENRYVISNGTTWSNRNLLGPSNTNLYAWGRGEQGQLGDETTVAKNSPIIVSGGLTDWIHASSGQTHSLAVRVNGTAWGWGRNVRGAVGDDSTTNRSSPVSVVGGFTDWIQVSAGGSHSVGVRANGTAWAWGQALGGRLGDGQAGLDQSSPVSVRGGFTDWVQVSAGTGITLGLRANGVLYGWGDNANGSLGDNSVTSRLSPVSVVGTGGVSFGDWVQASAGNFHSAGIRANGTLWTWGANANGSLGDNTTTTASKSSPVSVVGGFTDWTQVNAGPSFCVALRANGTLWSWGLGTFGRLGNGFTTDRSSPVSVVGGFTDWVNFSAANGQNNIHVAAVRANGTLWTWGANQYGALGNDTSDTVSVSSPVSVSGGFTDWIQVSSASWQNLALRG